MSNQQLDICDIHELLFDSQETNCKFDFLQAWHNLDGSINDIKSAQQQQTTESCIFPEIGDITTPASVMNDSPLMDTPFLDSSINTPYTPASVFTPSLAQFQNYPTYVSNPLSGIDELSDIQVASYLKKDVSWPEFDLENAPPDASSGNLFLPQSSSTPAPNASSDPSSVLFDNVNSADDDSLFPPLSSDSGFPSDNTLVADYDNSTDLFNSDDFTSNLFDDGDFVFDDCFVEPIEPSTTDNLPIVLPTVELPTPMPLPELTTNKRKQDDSDKSKNIPKPKRRKFKTPLDSEERKFECPVCQVSFSRRYNLGTHVKTHNVARTKEYPCTLCTKGFDRKHDLSRHVATVHNGERAFSCALCTCTFSRKDALGRHMTQKHSDIS
ncbi:hypothetical protein K501DRAFT_230973 [Backusella circina FSU 941]|nr:hypothetical protein K501DRAFT_230973 [Backusella circina FSU 941]